MYLLDFYVEQTKSSKKALKRGPVEEPPKVFVLVMFLHELNRNRLFLMHQLAWTRGRISYFHTD
jgi:hypothetical protein